MFSNQRNSYESQTDFHFWFNYIQLIDFDDCIIDNSSIAIVYVCMRALASDNGNWWRLGILLVQIFFFLCISNYNYVWEMIIKSGDDDDDDNDNDDDGRRQHHFQNNC